MIIEQDSGMFRVFSGPTLPLFDALSFWKRMFRIIRVQLFLLDIGRFAVVAVLLQRFFQMSTELRGAFFKPFASTAAVSAVLAIQH